jgi:uncharacterized membrane protein
MPHPRASRFYGQHSAMERLSRPCLRQSPGSPAEQREARPARAGFARAAEGGTGTGRSEMAESTRLRRSSGQSADKLASDGRAEAEREGPEAQEGPAAQEDVAEAGNGEEEREPRDGGERTLTSELRETIREAAIEVLRPVARKATTSAAKYAVSKGPELVKDRVAPKISEAGGAGALAKGVASKGGGVASSVTGAASGITEKLGGKGKKGKSPTGTGRGRRLPVQVYVDVASDLETTYDQFTQFEDWPQFMHRVEKIEQRDDTTLMWHENIWGVRRSWEADITEQKPCERIAWRSKEGPQSVGVATFHRLSDNLTRVYVNLDFQPQGLFEKTASGTRISRRALKSDLMRFKAFVEMRDEATGAWRGRVEEAEVVEPPEGEAPEEEEPEAKERTAKAEEDEAELEAEEEEEEPADEERTEAEEEQPEAEDAVNEPEEEEYEEEEPERKPVRRRTSARTAARRRG